MNRALTLKWFAVLGLASLFYLLLPVTFRLKCPSISG